METKFNFKSSVCTSREQSERLLALGLKKETADMHWFNTGTFGWQHCSSETYIEAISHPFKKEWATNGVILPAWSLHMLLCLIPKEVNIDGYRFPLRFDVLMRLDEADDMYEYIIGALERAINEGYFPKEYLV